MTRQNTMQEIIDEMNRSAKTFAEQSGAITCETFSVFKKGSQAENIKQHFAELVYPAGYVLLFQYTAHGLAGVVNSILECYLIPDCFPALPYPLSHIAGFLEADTPLLLTIPMISDAQTMQDSFAQLAEVIIGMQPKIETLVSDSDRCAAVRISFLEHVFAETKKQITVLDDEALWTLEFFYTLLTNHMAGDPYLRYMYGNTDKALVKLERMKYKSNYEQRLIRLLQKEVPARPAVPLSVQENIRAKYNKNGSPKSAGKEVGALFFVESRNAELVLGPMAQLPFVFLPSFLMGICSSYYSRHFVYRLLFKKSYEKQQRLDHIENGPGSDRLMKVFFTLLLIGGMFFTLLMVKWNVKLLPNGIVDNSAFFSLKETYYRYKEVDKVYYKPNRIIDDEPVDFSSYVIALKNGEQIDLYDFVPEEKDYDEFLSLIRKKGVPVEKQP